MTAQPQRTVRNLIIFVACIMALPWLGWWLDVQAGHDPHNQQQSLGWLFFLITPLAASLLLRAFAGDGWKDFGLRPAFKGNGRWYLLALLYYPLSISHTLLIGVGLGVTSLAEVSAAKLALIGQTMLAMVGANFIKNIFEEFAWRGYLAPKMHSVLGRSLLGHALVGIVWFAWHLPYYLVLLSLALLQQSTSLSLSALLPLTLVSMLPTAVLYGEIRLRTNSVWPAVLLHVGGNVFFDALVAQKFFSLSSGLTEALFSPAIFSAVGIVLATGAGLWLYRQRIIE
jgi:membrane protease YdiL (CAAX protease family)